MDKNKLKKQAMGIVNQLFDLAEVPVDKRQEINDKADDYMYKQLLIQRVVFNEGELCEICNENEAKVIYKTCYDCEEYIIKGEHN